jgi:hypothetical protein
LIGVQRGSGAGKGAASPSDAERGCGREGLVRSTMDMAILRDLTERNDFPPFIVRNAPEIASVLESVNRRPEISLHI